MRLFAVILLLIPSFTYGQGVLESMQAEISAQKAEIATLKAMLAEVEKRLAKIENPAPPAPTELNLQLIGGWRLNGEFSRGQMAIDHATMRAFVVGHEQRNEVNEYKLPAMGVGSDINTWPKVVKTQTIPGWWQGGYGSGIVYQNGLKVVPKKFYDTAPPASTEIYSQDGTVQSVPVPRQRFGGFVKGVGSLELGSGGYESGQGFAMGPTLASLDGTKLIDFPQNAAWEGRLAREPNYWPKGADGWLSLMPRYADGTKATAPITDTTGLSGVWACDRVWGGGLRFAHGIYYWCFMGTGDIDYARQNETFAATNKTYLYRFDPVTYKLVGWKEWPVNTALRVRGQEISPDGKYVYLLRTNAWKSGLYTVDPILEVYEVK